MEQSRNKKETAIEIKRIRLEIRRERSRNKKGIIVETEMADTPE